MKSLELKNQNFRKRNHQFNEKILFQVKINLFLTKFIIIQEIFMTKRIKKLIILNNSNQKKLIHIFH